MSKSPEEYFDEGQLAEEGYEAQAAQAQPASAEGEEEWDFVEKYLGLEKEDILDRLGLSEPAQTESVNLDDLLAEPEEITWEAEPEAEAAREAAPEEAAPEDTPEDVVAAGGEVQAARGFLEDELRERHELQLISFTVAGQEFVVPIEAVQEVVRAVKSTNIPEWPTYLRGVVNLRGKVTPIVDLGLMLGKTKEPSADLEETGYIIICRRHGVQVGLLMERVSTMYRVDAESMEWGIDSRIGGDIEYVSALLKKPDGTLVNMLSIDRVVEKVSKGGTKRA